MERHVPLPKRRGAYCLTGSPILCSHLSLGTGEEYWVGDLSGFPSSTGAIACFNGQPSPQPPVPPLTWP